ncbi:MAG: hypothetical protein SF069_04565 [Phycisphaerae bacterium]|nr:hypothetical protein [Phycisphaerae bacterium]
MRRLLGFLPLSFCCVGAFAAGGAEDRSTVIEGTPLDRSLIGRSVVETMDEVIARGRLAPPKPDMKESRAGVHGEWFVPGIRATYQPASGEKYLVNKFGDKRMGIGFNGLVDVDGAFINGHVGEASAAGALQIIGYADGVEVARTEWIYDLTEAPQWMPIGLKGVDRIIFQACAKLEQGAWYGVDDLTYRAAGVASDAPIVIDFEDVDYQTSISGTNYHGLDWEIGGGEFGVDYGIPAPQELPRDPNDATDGEAIPVVENGSVGVGLSLIREFDGIRRGDTGTGFPPDTHGAIGPNHYVEVVNSTLAVYSRTGVRQSITPLFTFLPNSSGDPRVAYDHHSGRWIVLVTDFNTRYFLAVSATNNPLGAWFKTDFVVTSDFDANSWPDFPTLGFDANGIYSCFFSVNRGRGTIVAIDKAPLIASTQSLGTVTFFRNLPLDRAIQPAVTYGTPAGEFICSTNGTAGIRVRRVNPPLTAPTLSELGSIVVPGYSDPPDAPASNTATAMDTIDARLGNVVYRDGFLWATHCIGVGGFATVRWYQLRVSPLGVIQSGNIGGSAPRHYYFPSISVDALGNAVVGYSGSSTTEFIGVYYSGRRALDPSGAMSAPQIYEPGVSAINNIDNVGRNRWGDYSLTALDPNDEKTFWTTQTYARAGGQWGTRIAVVSFNDCDSNGIPDECDLSCASPGCNVAGCGQASDCNSNGVPDTCETDCNNNNIPDDCDITSGFALDCNGNTIPDSCDIAIGTVLDCNLNGVPDSCDLSSGTALDCNANGIPDSCDIASGAAQDCNVNGIPDACEIQAGTVQDCNRNGVPDSCDIAALTSADCNNNGIPDDCDVALRFDAVSPTFSPVGTGNPHTHTFTALPDSITDVTVEVAARGDFNTSVEFVTVVFNGQTLGDVLVNGFSDCPVNPDIDTLTISQATFNALINGNGDNAVVDLNSSAGVNPILCTNPPSSIRVALRYSVIGNADGNGNGIPDECEFVIGDMNCDGFVTVGDISGFVLALTDPAGYATAFPNCNINLADVNQDGFVTVGDISGFVALLTGGN